MNRYLEIFTDLKQQIIEETYPAHSLLPSENQLAAHYKVSRETIRKALVLLLENGYIQKKQGKGSIVLDIRRFDFPITGLTSYKELQHAQKFHSRTIVQKLEKKRLKQEEACAFELPSGSEVWQLIRQREIDHEIVILDKDYLLTSIVPELPFEAAEDSIYHYLEHEKHLLISYAQKEIVVEAATKEDREWMDLHQTDTHVVVVKSQVFLEDTRLFQYTESRHRLDRFRFVDFARRRHQ